MPLPEAQGFGCGHSKSTGISFWSLLRGNNRVMMYIASWEHPLLGETTQMPSALFLSGKLLTHLKVQTSPRNLAQISPASKWGRAAQSALGHSSAMSLEPEKRPGDGCWNGGLRVVTEERRQQNPEESFTQIKLQRSLQVLLMPGQGPDDTL